MIRYCIKKNQEISKRSYFSGLHIKLPKQVGFLSNLRFCNSGKGKHRPFFAPHHNAHLHNSTSGMKMASQYLSPYLSLSLYLSLPTPRHNTRTQVLPLQPEQPSLSQPCKQNAVTEDHNKRAKTCLNLTKSTKHNYHLSSENLP